MLTHRRSMNLARGGILLGEVNKSIQVDLNVALVSKSSLQLHDICKLLLLGHCKHIGERVNNCFISEVQNKHGNEKTDHSKISERLLFSRAHWQVL